MMDTAKHKLETSVEDSQDWVLPATQSWEYRRGVYWIHVPRSQTGQEKESTGQSMILKPLKLGAVKAYLTGELLAAGQLYFSGRKSHVQPDSTGNGSMVDDGILPVPVKTWGSRNYIWFRGNRYLLTAKIEGRQADYHQPGDLRIAIRTMRIFHGFTQKLILENQKQWEFLRFNSLAEWRKRLREMEICRDAASRFVRLGINPDWCRKILAYWPEFYEQALEAIGALENQAVQNRGKSEDFENVICYHDWAHHNLIINDNPRPGAAEGYLIDFDEILADRPVHDRANLISRYLRLYCWSPVSLARILKDFDHLYPWRFGELEWLRIYLTFPYEYWILTRQYFIEKQPWSMKYYQDQWNRKIACHKERRRVLEMLRAGV